MISSLTYCQHFIGDSENNFRFFLHCILGIEGLGGKADVKVSTDIYVQRNCVSFKKEGGKSRKKKQRVGGKG